MNRQLMSSLTAFFLALCSLLLLLFLFAFLLTLVVFESPTVSQVHVFSDPTTEMAAQVSLSPLPFAVSGLTLSTEIELGPVFIAPKWREALPTASKTPTMILIASATPTTEATSTTALSDFSFANRESEITPTPTVVATITPLPKPTLTNIVSDLTLTRESAFVNPTLTVLVAPSPEQTASPTYAPQPTILPSATETLTAPPPSKVPTVAPSPSEVPTAPPATLLPSSEAALPHVPTISDLTYQAMFQHIGAQHNIDWRLLASIAYKESSLNAEAVGKDGEQGLMQILPSTWDEFAPRVGVSDPFDPVSNVQVGTAYLAYLRERLIKRGYPEEYWALVAYNWGPNNLARLLQEGGNWGGIPMMRQDYAYQIIEEITESNNEWLQKKLQEPVY